MANPSLSDYQLDKFWAGEVRLEDLDPTQALLVRSYVAENQNLSQVLERLRPNHAMLASAGRGAFRFMGLTSYHLMGLGLMAAAAGPMAYYGLNCKTTSTLVAHLHMKTRLAKVVEPSQSDKVAITGKITSQFKATITQGADKFIVARDFTGLKVGDRIGFQVEIKKPDRKFVWILQKNGAAYRTIFPLEGSAEANEIIMTPEWQVPFSFLVTTSEPHEFIAIIAPQKAPDAIFQNLLKLSWGNENHDLHIEQSDEGRTQGYDIHRISLAPKSGQIRKI